MKTRSRNLDNRRSNGLNLESLESRVMLAADFQNPINIYDVDGSESGVEVTPQDVLAIINEMNAPQLSDPETLELPVLGEDDMVEPPYVDVDGDGYVTARDAIQVINVLIEDAATESEPTEVFAPSSAMVGTQAAATFGIVDDTLVNTTTRYTQSYSDVDTGPLGSSVLVWQSAIQDGSSLGIFGQRYDADGNQVGGEFQVNTTTRGSQRNPAVAVADDDSFMVVWQSLGQDGSGWGIYGQRFDADGNQVGGEFLVNATTRGTQNNPDIAFSTTANGAANPTAYTVVWEGRGNGDHNGIFARTVAADGTTGSGEILVNTSTSGDQSAPSVDGFADGAAIAWHGKGNGDHLGVFMRALSTNGASNSDQIMVNIDDRGTQKFPSISANADGSNVVVAWQQIPESGVGVWARQFNNLVGESSVIQVNQTTSGSQKGPAIDHLADGGFVAAWYGRGEGDPWGTFSRTFDSSGTATSDEILANQSVRSLQIRPAIAAANAGYIVTWHGKAANDFNGVFARFENTEITGPFSLDPISDSTIDEGTTFTTTANVTDIDGVGDNVTFTLLEGPDGAVIAEDLGIISWVTTEADGPGSEEFIVEARDGEFAVTESFVVTVNEVNQAPTLTAIGDQTVIVGTAFNASTTASDADVPAQTVTLAATTSTGDPLPGWLSFDAGTGSFSGSPAIGDVGNVDVLVTATDSEGASATETFTITVTEIQTPTAPSLNDHFFRISSTAANGTSVGTVMATDPNAGETFNYAINSGNDAGAFTINASTGEITVLDSTALVADSMTDLVVMVTDSDGLTDTADVRISTTDNALVVRYTLTAEDTSGVPISSVTAGQEFDLIMSTQDVRDPANGVFAPFADVTYPDNSVTVAGDIIHADTYDTVPSGDTDTLGLLDEVGGLDGFDPLGGGVFEVFRIRMTVGNVPNGTSLNFATSAADDMVQHATLVFLDDDPVMTEDIDYGTLTLNVGVDTQLAALSPTPDAFIGVITNDLDEIQSPLSSQATTDGMIAQDTSFRSTYSATEMAFEYGDRGGDDWWNDANEDADNLELLIF